ncbi:MAG: hypothetical protein FWD08_03630 [Alphaproteobacteria bacterium]|nr:hypothetical protein [Alphaproteobacteria bacterium]
MGTCYNIINIRLFDESGASVVRPPAYPLGSRGSLLMGILAAGLGAVAPAACRPSFSRSSASTSL